MKGLLGAVVRKLPEVFPCSGVILGNVSQNIGEGGRLFFRWLPGSVVQELELVKPCSPMESKAAVLFRTRKASASRIHHSPFQVFLACETTLLEPGSAKPEVQFSSPPLPPLLSISRCGWVAAQLGSNGDRLASLPLFGLNRVLGRPPPGSP